MGSNANTYGLIEMDLFLVQSSLLKGLCGNQCWFWGEFSRKMEVKFKDANVLLKTCYVLWQFVLLTSCFGTVKSQMSCISVILYISGSFCTFSGPFKTKKNDIFGLKRSFFLPLRAQTWVKNMVMYVDTHSTHPRRSRAKFF